MKPTPPAEFPMRSGAVGNDSAVGQWQALHRAAAAVAMLAGEASAASDAALVAFPARMARVGGWRERLARQGIADLAAVMEPGLSALIAVDARGADPKPAARALLVEFTASRDALLTLAAD